MSSETAPKASIERRVLYCILAAIVGASLASAFTHMHDWTLQTIDEALKATGSDKRTPGWIGWANAVISELLPAAAFLLIRERNRQRRSVTVPMWIFIGAAALSLVANLSATGVSIPGAAQFLACLPALATIILSKVIFSDLGHAAELAEQAAAEAERRAELAAEQRRREAEQAAERAAELRRRDAELAAEQSRLAAEQAAELERQRIAAEADAAERIARVGAEAATRRAEIEAADRAAERAARERAEAREAAAREAAAVEAARVQAEAAAELQRAEAARVEAAAERQRQGAALLAQRAAERAGDVSTGGATPAEGGKRKRLSTEQTAALVDAVLSTLPAGTSRADAVKAVVAQLDCTPEYARRFVPAGFVAGGPVVGSAAARTEVLSPNPFADEEGGAEVPRGRHLTVA